MENVDQWGEMTLNSLKAMGSEIAAALPQIAGALVVLLLGWLAIRIVLWVLRRILRVTRVSTLSDRLNEGDLFGSSKFKIDLTKIILGFAKWLLYLVLLIVVADILNWTIISEEIGNLLRYLPRLFSAMALILIGLYIANYLKKTVKGIFETFEFSGSKIFSNLVFYVILIMVSITALNQAGVDTTMITNNITLIFGALLAALALGFGLGSREVLGDLLRAFYTRKTYVAGDKISIPEKGIEGTVESVDSIFLVIKTAKGKTVVPIKEVVENRVDVEV